jgi:hypothetical protein
MSKHLYDQLQTLQQPLVSYSQQQQWPNQPPGADEGDDTDLDPAGTGDDDLDGEDDDLAGDDDDLDTDEPADEPADEPPATDGISEALKAERRRTNQLERELRTMRRQLAQFSKINPDEYERLQDAERQKVQLEREIANRERQLQLSADRKVRTVAKERDAALAQVEELRKDRLLERLFIDAEGRPGGDNRGSFFEIFKQQVGGEFKLEKDGHGRDKLVPIDSKGNPLLGDDGQVSANDHVESLRTHPVLSFLFQQRGGLSPTSSIAEFDGSGNLTNLQELSASELYRASFSKKPASARR